MLIPGWRSTCGGTRGQTGVPDGARDAGGMQLAYAFCMHDALDLLSSMAVPVSSGIDGKIMDAVPAGWLRPGGGLGKHHPATLFAVSCSLVWKASPAEARGSPKVRCATERGMPAGSAGMAGLRDHLRHEQRLLDMANAAERGVRLGNFPGHPAEILGNPATAAMLRDPAARTLLHRSPRPAPARRCRFRSGTCTGCRGPGRRRDAEGGRDHPRHAAVMPHAPGATAPSMSLTPQE
ncbi:hypothetical protein [Roseomonas haemaphysalidis]|uniref:Uncharacterized protein n=1 Tax=Roseomonas haemaphysalidis TaxID=2768162 RepID=A0ABS3KT00_9PROT|nr:hypothetical protein [Roseomonas haemaphysalidis]MBO1080075.1 hypothetical protein [Roseomonas haemaphysalidis]